MMMMIIIIFFLNFYRFDYTFSASVDYTAAPNASI